MSLLSALPLKYSLIANGALLLAIALVWGVQQGRIAGARFDAAEAKRETAQLRSDIAEQRAQFALQARAAEQRQSQALNAVAELYEQDKTHAQQLHDGVVADLRAGALRLRRQWEGCEAAAARVPATGTAATQPDAAAELRAASAARIVRAGADCDARIRGLQAVVREYAAGGVH